MIKQSLKIIAGDPDKPLSIGGIEISCFVIEDETRAISKTSLSSALNATEGGRRARAGAVNDLSKSDIPNKTKKSEVTEVNLPRFLTRKWLQPFISDKLGPVLQTPILIDNPMGGGVIHGYPATILVDICAAILDANDAGVTTYRQDSIVSRAKILMRGFATVGIIGLVDEATGYQEIRAKRALYTILEQYIAKELRPWVKTFPDTFYEELYRLWGIEHLQNTKNHPQFFGTLTNEFIYDPLAPGVLIKLQELNPLLESGYRESKHHQLLTGNYGYIKLVEHLAKITILMQLSKTKEHFRNKFEEVFHGKIQLPYKEDLDRL